MSRYIDAERLKQFLKPIEWGTPDERWIPEHEIGAMLDYFPAADVVEVVRCKDCKWFKSYGSFGDCHNPVWGDGWANYPSPTVSEDGFCSYGEKR